MGEDDDEDMRQRIRFKLVRVGMRGRAVSLQVLRGEREGQKGVFDSRCEIIVIILMLVLLMILSTPTGKGMRRGETRSF